MSKISWDIIVPVKLPIDLKGVKPGELPGHLLRPARGEGGKPCGQLHWLAAAAWSAMCEAAEKDGVILKPVSAGDTYRTIKMQLTAFLSRYQKEPIAGAQTRTYEGVKWYKKDPKLASLAAPGTSQHNLGIAVDVHTAGEPKRLGWLVANVRRFGFSWEVVPEEPWHLRFTEGLDIPAEVKAYMGKNNIEVPAAAPSRAASTVNLNVASPISTSKKNEFKELQEALKSKGFYNGEVDGTASAELDAAIKAFKIANKLKNDSVVGPKVKELLGLK